MVSNSNNDSESVSPGKTGKSGLFNQWGGKFAFFFTYIHLSHDLTTGLLPALLPFIREDLSLNYLQSGLLVTAFSLTAGLSQLLGGWLSDRISKTKAMTIGLGGVGLSAIAISLVPSYQALLGVLVALGIFAGFYHPSGISTLSTHFEKQRRGRVMALHMVGGSLGFGLGPLLGAIIASRFNWHLAYAILAIPTLVGAAMIFTQLKLAPDKPQKDALLPPGAINKTKGVWQVFKPAIGIIALSAAMQLITGPILSFLSLYLMDTHHLTAAAASMWVTIVRFGGLAGNFVGGWLTDKWGRWKTIFLNLLLFGPVVLMISWLPFGFTLGAALVIFGCLMAMRESTMQTILMDSSPPQLRATVIGIYFSFGQQGSSIIQPVAGDFMDAIGIDGVFNSIGYISVGLSVLTVFLLFKNRGKANSHRL